MHFKIYPIIHGLAFLLFLRHAALSSQLSASSAAAATKQRQTRGSSVNVLELSLRGLGLPLQFTIVSAGTFFALLALFYTMLALTRSDFAW